jgi:hypothetical protein
MGMNAGGAEDEREREREREREEKYCHIMIIVNRCGMRKPTQTARKQGGGGGVMLRFTSRK